jgi:tRNA ligase
MTWDLLQLCDDSFEEHVLPYPPEQTGLHLHGLNESTKAFKTLPQATVDAFAEEWGFIKTLSHTLNSIPEVKAFTDEAGKTGKWNGEAVEGFVVRSHVAQPSAEGQGTINSKGKSSAPPYPPGSTFFFKVKFDEPYMMYRDWREITKSMLSAKGSLSNVKISASRMKRPETRLYVKWITQQILKDRKPFAEYTKGKGIISTREKFLKWLDSGEELKGLNDVEDVEKEGEKTFGKTIILPVAVPGCGKLYLQHESQSYSLAQVKLPYLWLLRTYLASVTRRVTMCMRRKLAQSSSRTSLIYCCGTMSL